MKLKRAGFTLIELMISITILSIIMLFLYKSYATLNISNQNLKFESHMIENIQKIKKVIYLDYSLALVNSVVIINRDKREDFVYMQSSHSIHRRFNPFISYMIKEDKLYRLESLQPFKEYQLASDSEFDIDFIAEVKNFRVYKSTNTKKNDYLVHIDLKSSDEILLKINNLNEK